MRGKGKRNERIFWRTGITPAYAGKSKSAGDATIFQRDHPRLCGEKVTTLYIDRHVIGSPPPMRGKVRYKSPHGL